MTEAGKKKLSEAIMGEKNPMKKIEAKEKMRGILKKHWRDPEFRKHMEEVKKGRWTGEKNPLWKGGISKTREYHKERRRKRRVRKLNAKGSHTFGEWELLKKQYGHCCLSCGKCEPEIILTEDHIIPLSKGGSDYIENIQPLCRSCNCKKHTKIIKY